MSSNINREELNNLIDTINNNRDLVIHNYKDKKDQILLSKELIDKLIYIVSEITDDKEKAKSIKKLAIREAFILKKSDIVISKNGQYFIKLFDNTKKNTDSEERRYDGINEEDLKSFHDEFFLDEENKKIFPIVAKEFVSIFFTEKKVTNDQYEKNVFKYIQAIIYKHLTLKYDNSDGFFNGFAGYIFRIHFKDVFEYIADIILDKISNSDKYMLEFINYYSLNILVLDKKKYKIPAMETSDGLRWNTASILSISKKYIQTLNSKKILENEINQLKKETSKYLVNGVSPVEHQDKTNRAAQQLDLELKSQTYNLHVNLDSLALTKDLNEKDKLNNEIKDIQNSIKTLGKQKKGINLEVIDDSILKKYNESRKILDTKSKELKNKEMVINQNKNLYSSMRESLVKALIAKKKLL